MTLLALCSAHGAPGVTTSAVALAGAWPADREVVVVEADPFGGVLAARFGLGDSPGLGSLAAVARTGLTVETLLQHTQAIPGGLPVVVGATSPEQAHGMVRDVTGPLLEFAADEPIEVVVDCGRVGPGAPTLELLRSSDQVLVVCRPTVEQLRLAAHRLHALEAAGAAVGLLLMGDSPYSADEIASTLDVPVVGTLAFDASAAAALSGGTGVSGRQVGRSALARTAATLAERLASPPPSPVNAPAPADVRGGRR